jgi:hypothetical protein
MYITHSYIGTTLNGAKCLFFLLYEDYLDAQANFAKELDRELERFARNLGNQGAVVRPFTGDIQQTRTHILEKNWTQEQLQLVKKTPSLLMINVDFDSFNPQQHPWFLFNFGEKIVDGVPHFDQFKQVFDSLANTINSNNNVDIFKVTAELQHEINKINISDAAKIFEAKPGIFGFSVDIIRGLELLRRIYPGRPEI